MSSIGCWESWRSADILAEMYNRGAMAKHTYLGFRCTSPNCGVPLLYRYLGLHEEIPSEPQTVPDYLELPCGACNTVHSYTRDQMEFFQTDSPPAY